MSKFTLSSFVFIYLISITTTTRVVFDCYLNYKTKNQIKLGFTYYNLIASNDSKRIYDLNVYKVHHIYEQEPSKNGLTPEHVSVSDIVVYGDGMNILHYSENGSTIFHYLGNMATRKFRAFNIHVKLMDPTEKYHKNSDVPVEDILNQSLYYKGQMPYFEFEVDGNVKTAICELSAAPEPVKVENELAQMKQAAQIQRSNSERLDVRQNVSQSQVLSTPGINQNSTGGQSKNFLVL